MGLARETTVSCSIVMDDRKAVLIHFSPLHKTFNLQNNFIIDKTLLVIIFISVSCGSGSRSRDYYF